MAAKTCVCDSMWRVVSLGEEEGVGVGVSVAGAAGWVVDGGGCMDWGLWKASMEDVVELSAVERMLDVDVWSGSRALGSSSGEIL